ncbi:hypothetical protein PFISCL1PPCAC_22547 [Pristionchus fissidentatus]|uniref:BTB domain-containing protein n=1 Tax=Pristionchus fissidentatus TaxID=1538716 RepID=A0AAV5WHY6_9BILA|nr:hypothetical protein PFISCL1PPCAC_22547 [Pristionchus fissidentatus]
MTADRKNCVMTVPVMRVPSSNTTTSATLDITLKMASWSGIYSRVRTLFDKKSDLTDATLMVQGTPLYVIRSMLSLHSPYFYNIFYNRNFSDAAKEEYTIDDVTPDNMRAFLRLLYPRVPDSDTIEMMESPDQIEEMLILAERFNCDTVKLIMEKYLMDEPGYLVDSVPGGTRLTAARRLLLADRYRLSAVCSDVMRTLRNADSMGDLRHSEEYEELSDSIKAAILDVTTAAPKEKKQRRSRDSFDNDFFTRMRSHDSPPRPVSAAQIAAAAAAGTPLNTSRRITLPPPRSGGLMTGAPAAAPAAPAPPTAQRTRHVRFSLQPPPGLVGANGAAAPAVNFMSDPRDGSWRDFRADLMGLSATADSYALSSRVAVDLDRAIQFLEGLTRADYDELGSGFRIPLHANIRTLLDVSEEGGSRAEAVRQLLSQVDTVRLEYRSIAAKKRRLTN